MASRIVDNLKGELHTACNYSLEGRLDEHMSRDENPSRIKRLAQAFIRCAASHPNHTRYMMSSRFRSHGMDYLGSGYHADVIRSDDEVYKLYRATSNLSAPEQADYASNLQAENDLLCTFLGDNASSTMYHIVSDPFRDDSTLVVGQQSYVEQSSDDMAISQDMLRRCVDFYLATGRLVDIFSSSNLVATEKGPVLIDTTPIPKAMVSFHIKKFESMLNSTQVRRVYTPEPVNATI